MSCKRRKEGEKKSGTPSSLLECRAPNKRDAHKKGKNAPNDEKASTHVTVHPERNAVHRDAVKKKEKTQEKRGGPAVAGGRGAKKGGLGAASPQGMEGIRGLKIDSKQQPLDSRIAIDADHRRPLLPDSPL